MDVMATESSTGVVYRLIYRSHNCIPATSRRSELGDLFTAARSNNKAKGITGALLVRDDLFVQTLEGDEQSVEELLARIRVDTRHEAVEILNTGLVSRRVFARWSMAKVGEDDLSPDVNLIAHGDGISPAATRGGATAEQELVLQVMRDAARKALGT